MTTSSKRWSKRRYARGVAMVEAGILAPIFAMMMMMTVYLGGIYQTKYKSFMLERYNTWHYVSNSCTTGDGDEPEQATPQQTTPPGGSYGDQAQGGPQASSSMFIGHGHSTLEWAYAPTLKFNNGNAKSITTEGWAVCNEKKNGMNVFQYMGGVISQATGGL
jgi:hypothetical protein